MHQLRAHTKPPQWRRPHLIDGSLFETTFETTRFILENPLLAPFRAGLDLHDALAGLNVIRNLLAVLKTSRRQVGMLGLRDAITSANVMQQEVTVRMDDLVPERARHGGHVAAALPAEGLNRRPRGRRRVVGMVANGAAERVVIPEQL